MRVWFCRLLAAVLPASCLHAQEVSFQRDIRPLLSDRCFKCHGFDEEAREAGLGLHSFAAATRDLDGRRAVVPGDSAASELVARLVAEDPDEAMPPPKSNKPRFSPEEVALMKRWIDEGAKYEEHWAFVKPVRPPLPEVGESGSAHPVDRFLDAALAGGGLPLNGPADPRTLVRRLSYDLRGLPPTVEETEAFLAARAEDPEAAWTALVDAFLASPAYGEHWARAWLDLARYADTNGYEKDRPRSIWPYRDWVVRALNADLPYDRFTIEQIAGDMLPDPTTDQLVATGFHRNTMLNEEGGIDPLEFRYHAMVDRVATTGSVWMGLTTGCAQCHTHKFDPVTHTDYFALFALLNNADEPEIEVPDPALLAQREKLAAQIDALEEEETAAIDEAEFQAWLAGLRGRSVPWTPLPPRRAASNLPLLEIEPDHSVYASGDFTKRDRYEVAYDLSPLGGKAVTALRLEALPDPRLPGRGPGVAYYEGRKGDFFLSEVTAEAGGVALAFSGASVSFGRISIGSGEARGENVYDGDGSTGWSCSTREGEAHHLVLKLAEPIVGAETLELSLLFERHFAAALGRFRLSAATAAGDVAALPAGAPDPFDADEGELRRAFVRASSSHKMHQDEVAALRRRMPALPTTLVMRERPPHHPRPTHRHHRGDYLSPREPVAPAVPAIFDPIPEGAPANRLSFAKWLVSERNPLAARVAANRAWRGLFGRGLVHTSGDYGYQSAPPSHPELLDWLAVEFVEQGWSLKRLHRLLATSAAYRRDSRVDPVQFERDPDNLLLSRGARFRLTGEMLRDGALRAAGLLSPKQGGPGVYPPQPESVVELAYGSEAWSSSVGEQRYRRSLYTFSKRTAPFAAYLAFDGPTGESCLPRRERSNTPLQALTLLNDPMFHEAAEALARRVWAEAGDGAAESAELLDALFRHVLSRPPDEREAEDFLAFHGAQWARLATGELKAAEILSAGNGPVTPGLAAWAMVARVLLNLNETLTRG